MSFTPVTNATGTAIITVTADNGQAQNNLVTQAFTVTVKPVYLAPTLNALGNVSINENVGVQTVNLSGISLGSGSTLVVTASSSNPALIPNPAVTYTSPTSTGSLSFTPVTNATGTATITVTANNGQAQNNLVTQAFTVTVASIYKAPTLAPLKNVAIKKNGKVSSTLTASTSQSSQSAAQIVSLTGISLGSGSNLTITASSSNPALIPNPAVDYVSPSATGSLTLTPAQNLTGAATVTVTADNGQPLNNITTQTFEVTVLPPNLLPTLDPIADLTLDYNAAAQVVGLSGIAAGVNSTGHKIQITAVSSNPKVVPNPKVDYINPQASGSLIVKPAPKASGTAVITVKVNDGGKTNNIFIETFTVTVLPNQMPTMDPIAGLILSYNSAAQTINLSGIGPGASGEIQKLTITAVSSNPKVVPSPKMNYINPQTNGSLTVKPVLKASGTAIITVKVNDGGKTNNIFTQTFTVTVLPLTPPPASVSVQPLLVPAILTSAMDASGRFSLTVTGASDNQYVVEASSDLVHWTPVYTNTASFTFVDDQAGQFAKRFYRTESVLVP